MAGFFGMFNYTKPGRGVSKDDLDKTGIALYFDILGRRIGKIILLNVLFLVASIPAILIGYALSALILTYLSSFSGNAIVAGEASVMMMIALTTLILVTGTGPASVAMSYVLRKFVNDTHAWAWSEFWDNLKSNFKQGILAYIINTVVISVLAFGFMFYFYLVKGPLSVVLTGVIILIAIVFLMMQLYVYQIIASVKLKVKDVYRNAFLLSMGRLPMNVLALVITVLVICGFSYIVTIPASIAVIFLIFYSLTVFTQVFITNNTINKYLIEPSKKAEKETSEITEE